MLDWPWARVHLEVAAAGAARRRDQRDHYRTLALITRMAQVSGEEGHRAWIEFYESFTAPPVAAPPPTLPDGTTAGPLGLGITPLPVAPA